MPSAHNAVIVIGAGGHARPVLEALRLLGIPVAALLDEAPSRPPVLGQAVNGGLDLLGAIPAAGAVIAIGHNATRLRLAEVARAAGLALPTLVHPAALVSAHARLGEGVQVMARAVIGPEASLGALCLINTGAIVEHECVLAAGVHLGPGTVLCGGVLIGALSLIGAGVTVAPGQRIGADAVVGAGAAVAGPVPDGARFGGVPARPI